MLNRPTRVLVIFSLIFLAGCSGSTSQEYIEPINASNVLNQWKSDCKSNKESIPCETWMHNQELQKIVWDGNNEPEYSLNLTADLIPDNEYSANKGILGRLFCSKELNICVATVSLQNNSTRPYTGVLSFDLSTSTGVFASDRAYSLTAPLNPSVNVSESFGVNLGNKIPEIYFIRVILNNEYVAKIELCEKVDYLDVEENISNDYVVYENCLRLNGYDFKNGVFERSQS